MSAKNFKISFNGSNISLFSEEFNGWDNTNYTPTTTQKLSTNKSKVHIKKAVFANAEAFWNWCAAQKLNPIKESVLVQFLDDNGQVFNTVTLGNAQTMQISTINQVSETEILVEDIEVAFETLRIKA